MKNQEDHTVFCDPDEIIVNKGISREEIDVFRTEQVVPASDEPIGPIKPFMPTPKENPSDEDFEQLDILQKMFPEAKCIIMYEEESAIQIDFDGTPVIHQDTIRNLEDRGYCKIVEFPCKCNCGGYSLLIVREF